MNQMNRRELLQLVGTITGTTLTGSYLYLLGGKSVQSKEKIIPVKYNDKLLELIAQTILPVSFDGVFIGSFIYKMVLDCYTKEEQSAFFSGLDKFEQDCNIKTNKKFKHLTLKQREEYLLDLEKIARNSKSGIKHYFLMIKELTILGYFTSEVGMKKSRKYVEVPGKFIGDYPYKSGDLIIIHS